MSLNALRRSTQCDMNIQRAHLKSSCVHSQSNKFPIPTPVAALSISSQLIWSSWPIVFHVSRMVYPSNDHSIRLKTKEGRRLGRGPTIGVNDSPARSAATSSILEGRKTIGYVGLLRDVGASGGRRIPALTLEAPSSVSACPGSANLCRIRKNSPVALPQSYQGREPASACYTAGFWSTLHRPSLNVGRFPIVIQCLRMLDPGYRNQEAAHHYCCVNFRGDPEWNENTCTSPQGNKHISFSTPE